LIGLAGSHNTLGNKATAQKKRERQKASKASKASKSNEDIQAAQKKSKDSKWNISYSRITIKQAEERLVIRRDQDGTYPYASQ